MQTLELKIPPVALVIIAALLMWVGALYYPLGHFSQSGLSFIGLMFGLLGMLACGLGVLEFNRAKTTVNPTKPQLATALVKTGTRNPMYVGFVLILTGCGVAFASMAGVFIVPAFVIYMNRFQIAPEERAMGAIFGDDFAAYCQNVRRWI